MRVGEDQSSAAHSALLACQKLRQRRRQTPGKHDELEIVMVAAASSIRSANSGEEISTDTASDIYGLR